MSLLGKSRRCAFNGFIFRLLLVTAAFVHGSFLAAAQDALSLSSQDQQIRDRYLTSLRQTPLQEQAFNRVYESYLANEGVDAWVTQLKDESAVAETKASALILLGRVYQRQFKTKDAIAALEEAKASATASAELQALLGALYAEANQYDRAIESLAVARDGIGDPVKRGEVCRLLGGVYMRLGKRDEAIASWKQLVELAPEDPFAYDELASIYEDNLMWAEAVGVRTALLEKLDGNPYLQCRTWRAIGRAHERAAQYPEAIVAYERALELAAPGNWLFEEAKDRLVDVYERMGNLDGLQQYLEAKIAAQPADVEFAHLLADTLARRGKLEDAERILAGIVERSPERVSAYEDLLALYSRKEAKEKLSATFEKLIALFPTEPDYLRRFGESLLLAGDPAAAKETWKRLIATDATPEKHATLADWYEQYEFRDDAIASYEAALAARRDKEWVFRLAALKYDAGKTDEAVALWKSAVNDQGTASDYAEVAALLAANQQDDEATALYKRALELDPNGHEYRAALARLYMSKEAYAEALEQFTALEAQTENEYHKSLGERGMIDVYVATGQLEAKQQEWQAEVAAHPDQVTARLRLARLYQRMGNPQEAIALYIQCAELEPDKAEHVRQLANAYTATRQTEKAIAAYQTLIALDNTRIGQYYRELVQLYLAANRKDEAIAAAERVAELAPEDPEVRVTLAQTYLAQQRPDDAFQQFRNAVRLKPDAARFHALYGDALASAQRWGEAQDAYRKMLDASQSDAERIDAVTRLANVYMQQQRLPELVQEFNERSRQTPKSIVAYQELAAIHRASGNIAPIVELYETAAGVVDDKEAALRQLLNAAYDAGKLDKVVSTYEQLMAMSGTPTMNEWERLGAAYAQMGDLEKAQAAWDRIAADNPDNPAAFKLLARALDSWGQADKAIEAREKAIQLDPTDYALRVEHARNLASNDRLDDAMNELLTLLEASQLDDGSAAQPNQQQPTVQPMPRYRGGRSSMGYPGMQQRAPYGTLAYHRPEIINFLVESARQTGNIDPIVERLKKRMDEMPANIRVRQDLLDVYMQLGKNEEAVALAQSVVEQQPDNIEMRMQMAGLFQRLQRMEEAEREYRAVLERSPERKREIELMLVYLYRQFEKNDEALALAESIYQASTDDVQIVLTLAQLTLEIGSDERARELFRRAGELDPQNALEYRFRLASSQQQRGQLDAARAGFEEILFATVPAGPQNQPRQRYGQGSLYIPRPDQRSGHNSAIMQLNISQADQIRIRIMEQLERMIINTEQLAPLYERVRVEAEKWFAAESDEARQAAWPYCLLHMSRLDRTDAAKEALAFAQRIRERAPGDPTLRQIVLYAMHRAADWDGMLALYKEAETADPSLAPSVLEARMNIAMQQDKLEEALELIRQRIAQSPPQSRATHEIYTISQRLRESNRADLLIPFLEEQTFSGVPTAMFVQLLVEIYGQQNLHDKAIELARRTWEASQRNAAAGVRGSRTTGHGMPGSNDPAFQMLLSAYDRAGRTAELTAEIEERVAKQPGSVRLRECQIALYQRSNRTEEAIALYKELVAMRPNSPQSKMEFAQFLANSNHASDAIPIYEELLKTQPSLYFSVSWQIRQAYEQAGRKQDLHALEQNMAERATNADQLEQLAQQMLNDQSFERAAEVYARALQIDPKRVHLRTALADSLQRAGKVDDAIRVYKEYFAQAGSGGGADFHVGLRVVDLYANVERLAELKEEMTRSLNATPTDRNAKSLLALIAKREERYDDANRLLEELYAAQSQPDILMQMVDVLEKQQNYDRAIEIMETKLAPQGNIDWNKLALLYLKKGDRKKASETWQREATVQSGNYAAGNVLRNLLKNALWEEAEAYYRATLPKLGGDREAVRQLNYSLIESAGNSETIAALVETEVFAQDYPNKVDSIRQYLQQTGRNPEKARAILDPLRKARPDDAELTRIYIDILGDSMDAAELLPVFTALIESSGSDDYQVTQCARRLIRLGHVDDVAELLKAWMLKQPIELRVRQVVSLLTQEYEGARMPVLALRESFLGSVPEGQRLTASIGFADAVAHAGDVPWAHDVLHGAYEANQFPIDRYLAFLLDWGYADEAQALAPLEAGRANRRWNFNFIRFSVASGDIDAAEQDAGKAFAESGDRNGLNAFRDYLGLHAMVRRFEEKATGDGSTQVMLKLAAIYDEIDDHQRALQLTRAVLEKEPDNGEAFNYMLYRFDHLGLKEEKLAFLEQHMDTEKLRGDSNDSRWQTLASAFLNADRKDDARRVLESATVTPDNTWQRMSRAAIYLRLGEPADVEKAYAEISAAGQYARDPNQLPTVIAGMIASGRVEEGMNLWRENPGIDNVNVVADALMKQNKPAEAAEVLRRFLERRPDYSYLHQQLALATMKSSADDSVWRAEYDTRVANSVEQNSDEIANSFARALNESGTAERLVDSPQLANDPVLRGLVMRALTFQLYDKKPGAGERFKTLVNAYPPTTPDELAACGSAILFLNEKDSALDFYRKLVAHPDASKQQVENANWVLINNKDSAAGSATLRLLELGDRNALNNLETLKTIGEKAEAATRQAIVERSLDAALPEAKKAFARAYIAYHAGERDQSIADIAALVDDRQLGGTFAREAVGLLDAAGRRSDAKRLCENMANGGYGRVNREFALDTQARWYAADGDIDNAMAMLCRMTSFQRIQAHATWKAICEKGNAESVHAAVALVVKESPTNDRVSELLLLDADVARRAGRTFDLATVCAELGVTGREADEAGLMDRMIETWRVSPAIELTKGRESMKEILGEDMKAALVPDAPLPTTQGAWTTTGPEQGAGLVWLDAVLGIGESMRGEKAAFAVTEITSLSDTTVTFSHAGDDYTIVWVNGAEVFRSIHGRAAFPDQDRFAAPLRAGKNRVVVAAGNGSADWGFALGMIDAPQGIQVSLPS